MISERGGGGWKHMIFNVIYTCRPLYKLDLYSNSIKTKKFTAIFLYRYRYLFRDNCLKSFFTFRRNKEYLSGIIIGIRPGSGSTFLVYRIGVTGYCKFYIAIFHDEDSIRSCLSGFSHMAGAPWGSNSGPLGAASVDKLIYILPLPDCRDSFPCQYELLYC